MGLIDKKEAILKLKEGCPVAVPTETVYGLAAPISNEKALKEIFSIKKRPLSDPLIVHVSSNEMALSLCTELTQELKNDFLCLSQAFWPGPLTLVLEKNPSQVPDLITASLNTVALRCPDSPTLLDIINEVGPLAAPSANLFKAVSPTKAEHVVHELPDVFVLAGESSFVGLESTIYDIQNKVVLRPGAVTAQQISNTLNKDVTYSEKLNTPGSEKDHYQPNQPVWVFENKDLIKKHESTSYTLMPLRDKPKEASKNLYQDLRDSDQKGKTIFVFFNPKWRADENWTAYENRLLKASSKWFKD